MNDSPTWQVAPRRHVVYLTEDATNPNGLLYRWTPPQEALPLGPGALRGLADDAGTLEAVKASDTNGTHGPDLSVATEPGTTYKVEWVNVPDRDAQTTGSTRKQFTNDRVTRSRKLEGMWWGDDGAYFVASFARTADGSAAQHDGQVWFIDSEAGTIELKLWFAFTPTDQDNDPDGPDNITVSAFGGLFIAEDGEGRQHLIGSTESGAVFFFARNMDPGNEESSPARTSPTTRSSCSPTSRSPGASSRSEARSESSASRGPGTRHHAPGHRRSAPGDRGGCSRPGATVASGSGDTEPRRRATPARSSERVRDPGSPCRVHPSGR